MRPWLPANSPMTPWGATAPSLGTTDLGYMSNWLMAEMAASHFLQVQVKSQVISLQVQVKSQVISLQVQVKSQVIWSDVKSSHKSFGQTSSQVTSHLVQTQVKSQVSLSKYKSSRTLFCPAVIRNQGQASNQSTVSYSQRYMKWSMVLNNLMYKYGVPYMYTH